MKICPQCGQQLEDYAKFCTRCGVAQPTNFTQPVAAPLEPTAYASQQPSAPAPQEQASYAYAPENPAPQEPVTPDSAPENSVPQEPVTPNYVPENPMPQEPVAPNYMPQNAAVQPPYQGAYYADPSNPYMNQAPYMGNQPVHDNNLFEAYKAAFKNYAKFEGRTRRRDYWFFALMNMIITFIPAIIMWVSVIMGAFTENQTLPFTIALIAICVMSIYSLAVLVPSLALLVRRLHDSGKSGWYALFGLIPYAGSIVLMVFCCMDSQVGPNKYGPNPKGINGQF